MAALYRRGERKEPLSVSKVKKYIINPPIHNLFTKKNTLLVDSHIKMLYNYGTMDHNAVSRICPHIV